MRELTTEARNAMARDALMHIVSGMPAKHLSVHRFADKLSGWNNNLPRSFKELPEHTIPVTVNCAHEIMCRFTGAGEPTLDNDTFNQIAYVLVVGYLWTNGLEIGKDARRRLYADDDGVFPLEDKFRFFEHLAKLLIGFVNPGEK